MTGVMIIFAFTLSLITGYIEKNIHSDNPYAKRKKENEAEPMKHVE